MIVATETCASSICNKQFAASDGVVPVVTTSSTRSKCFPVNTEVSIREKASLICPARCWVLSRTKVFVALCWIKFWGTYPIWSCLASCCPNCETWLYPRCRCLRLCKGMGTTRSQDKKELPTSFCPSSEPNRLPSCSPFIYFNWWMSCWSNFINGLELLRWKLVVGSSLKQWRQSVVFVGIALRQPRQYDGKRVCRKSSKTVNLGH